MRDFSEALTELRRRHGEAQQYLRVDELRRRRPQLEVELSRPDLWDDQAAAQAIQREFTEISDDLGKKTRSTTAYRPQTPNSTSWNFGRSSSAISMIGTRSAR